MALICALINGLTIGVTFGLVVADMHKYTPISLSLTVFFTGLWVVINMKDTQDAILEQLDDAQSDQ